MVKDIAFFAYSVRDVPRARAFYAETLGLSPGQSFGDHWIEFNVGNATFGIGNGEPLGFEPGSSTGAAFEVDDLQLEDLAGLVGLGCNIQGICGTFDVGTDTLGQIVASDHLRDVVGRLTPDLTRRQE